MSDADNRKKSVSASMRNLKTGQSVKKTIDLTEQLASKNGQQKRNVIGLSFGADEAGKPYISPRFGTPKNSNVSSTAVPETEGQQDLATPTTPPTQAPEPSSFVQTVPGRTIPSAVGLGKNPLVLINGKQYPADILLRLDPQKMGGPGTFGPSNPFALKKWGEKARDGVIEFTPRTADFELSDAGKRKIAAYNAENEFKALANSPRTRVVVRIPQMTYEGKRYEMVYCVSQSSRCGTEVFPGEKIAFILNGKRVSEAKMNAAGRSKRDCGAGKPEDFYAQIAKGANHVIYVKEAN